jgi:hypothetical protein
LTPEFWLKHNLTEGLALPAPAVDWLMHLWEATQFLDDVRDGDVGSDVDANIWRLLVTLPAHPFYKHNVDALEPAIAVAVLKWSAANNAEETGQADARSFVWRAGFYDIVVLAVALCHGGDVARQLAPTAMSLYGESFSDYLEEFA